MVWRRIWLLSLPISKGSNFGKIYNGCCSRFALFCLVNRLQIDLRQATFVTVKMLFCLENFFSLKQKQKFLYNSSLQLADAILGCWRDIATWRFERATLNRRSAPLGKHTDTRARTFASFAWAQLAHKHTWQGLHLASEDVHRWCESKNINTQTRTRTHKHLQHHCDRMS